MNTLKKYFPHILVGLVAILLAATTLAASLFVVRVRAASVAPQRTLSVSPEYSVYTEFVDVVLVIPSTTSEQEDMAAIENLVRQIHARGKDARVTLCSSQSKVFDTANDCVGIIYFRR